MTTRAARPQEREGRDYFFVSEAQFQEHQYAGNFIEWTKIYDHFYGTPIGPILHQLEQGKDVICALDCAGEQTLRAHSELQGRVVSVFIMPPHVEALKLRLKQRAQDSVEGIEKRLSKSALEIEQWIYYDYVVFNDNFLLAASEISAIICAEKLRKERQSHRMGKVIEQWK